MRAVAAFIAALSARRRQPALFHKGVTHRLPPPRSARSRKASASQNTNKCRHGPSIAAHIDSPHRHECGAY
jgi:hypothetical protein